MRLDVDIQQPKIYLAERKNINKKTIIFTAIAISTATITMLYTCNTTAIASSKTEIVCSDCHNHKSAMIDYFKRNKVLSPDKMAEAVLATKSPRLLAAINVAGEHKTPHTAIKTGWNNKYSGAWQTHPRWGKINKNTSITEQALIAELALDAHVKEERCIIKALNAYGGESNKINGKYAYNVLRELELNVP